MKLTFSLSCIFSLSLERCSERLMCSTSALNRHRITDSQKMLSWNQIKLLALCRTHHVPEIVVQMFLNSVRHGVVTTALRSLFQPVHALCENI